MVSKLSTYGLHSLKMEGTSKPRASQGGGLSNCAGKAAARALARLAFRGPRDMDGSRPPVQARTAMAPATFPLGNEWPALTSLWEVHFFMKSKSKG